MIFVATWDLYIRGINIETNKVEYQYVAAKDRILAIHVNSKYIFCAGYDNVIRAKSLVDGEDKLYLGNTGFIHSLLSKGNMLLSAGDNGEIKVWNIETTKMIELLQGHDKSSILQLCFINGDLYSSGEDNCIVGWDLPSLENRFEEKQDMWEANKESK